MTEIQFASDERVVVAAQCLADLARESESANDSAEHVSTATAAPSQTEKESADAGQAPHKPENEPEGATEALGVPTGEDKSHTRAGEQCATAQSSAQPTSSTVAPTQDATASSGRTTEYDDDGAAEGSNQDWITRFLKGDHDLLWTSEPVLSACPTLLTGSTMDTSDHLIDSLMDWERKFESADLEKHKQFLQEAKLPVCDSPVEATAWENGLVPEARGIPSDQLELRIQGSLPPLAYVVSRPRQPTTTGEDLMRRYDAGVRPHLLRDWQSGFGGYTKVYEYQVKGETRRKFSVAFVVRPRTQLRNVCPCFTLMPKMPDSKPWMRTVGTRDPSRGVLLDLQENCEWRMDSTVMLPNIDPITDMQVQCLPVSKWTHRKVPKVTAFRNFARLPLWSRKPQKCTYQRSQSAAGTCSVTSRIISKGQIQLQPACIGSWGLHNVLHSVLISGLIGTALLEGMGFIRTLGGYIVLHSVLKHFSGLIGTALLEGMGIRTPRRRFAPRRSLCLPKWETFSHRRWSLIHCHRGGFANVLFNYYLGTQARRCRLPPVRNATPVAM